MTEPNSQAPRSIAVTGGGGFVGRAVVQMLRERGHIALPVVRRPRGDPDERVVSDIADRSSLKAAFAGVDTVVHLAARAHEQPGLPQDDEIRRTNVAGTRAVYEVAAQLGIRRVLFASSAKAQLVYNGGQGREDVGDAYSASKREAEEFVAAFGEAEGLHAPVLRLPLVYGPGVRAKMLALFRAVDCHVPLPLASVRNRRSVVYLGNAAAALAALLEFPGMLRGVYSVSDPEPLSTPDLIRAIAHALGRRAVLLPMNPWLLRRAAHALAAVGVRRPLEIVQRLTDSLVVDPRPLGDATGFRALFTTDVGLYETARWFRSVKSSSR